MTQANNAAWRRPETPVYRPAVGRPGGITILTRDKLEIGRVDDLQRGGSATWAEDEAAADRIRITLLNLEAG